VEATLSVEELKKEWCSALPVDLDWWGGGRGHGLASMRLRALAVIAVPENTRLN
jgi:hypothetical protein